MLSSSLIMPALYIVFVLYLKLVLCVQWRSVWQWILCDGMKCLCVRASAPDSICHGSSHRSSRLYDCYDYYLGLLGIVSVSRRCSKNRPHSRRSYVTSRRQWLLLYFVRSWRPRYSSTLAPPWVFRGGTDCCANTGLLTYFLLMHPIKINELSLVK